MNAAGLPMRTDITPGQTSDYPGFDLVMDDNLPEPFVLLADKGYDPAYGARPLKRVIQKYLQDPLAEQILAGTITDGETVVVSADDSGLTINGSVATAQAA